MYGALLDTLSAILFPLTGFNFISVSFHSNRPPEIITSSSFSVFLLNFDFHCFPLSFLNCSKDLRALGVSTVGGISASVITKMFHLTINFHVQRDNENFSSILLKYFYTTNTMTVQRVEELFGEGGVVDFSYM